MGLTAANYLNQLQDLLPHGAAWPRDSDATLTLLLGGLAAELARVDGRAEQLIEEADPRTTAELFLDWERVSGLPDACAEAFGGPQTSSQRRAALVTKLATIGGQSPEYFIGLAAVLGHAITITEFSQHSVIKPVDYPIHSQEWNFAWQVNAALNTVAPFRVTDRVSDPLAAWGNALFECVLERLKPAHTIVLFAYS